MAVAAAHPCLMIKPADLARARENLKRYDWAREYLASLQKRADQDVERFTPAFVERMLEVTTPVSTIFTPCPACRDQHRTYLPHGQWKWSVEDPDKLRCGGCGTVFPNARYPETIALHSTWGVPQTFTFVGGEPFELFGYKTAHPSISGCSRASKVWYVSDECRALGEAYLLSGDIRFARAVRIILLRFAEVYPHWLVHSGYGDFADMDPRTASENITHLPADELLAPPTKPDRALQTGFWTAGRATGSGQESAFVRNVVTAYDAACEAQDPAGKAIFSDDEKRKIEKDLLLQSTILLVADKSINNKSVGNRAAAALVGMCVGEPAFVHFGVEGFRKTVDQWFLSDGGTPESPSYALMAFTGTVDLPLAARGYSDPVGYHDSSDGSRFENLDLYHGTAYERAWSTFIDGLQGDCSLVPYADTHPHRQLDSMWADLLVAQYPDRPQYLALLKELCGDDLHEGTARIALYYREPGLEKKKSPPLSFPDLCPPDLRIGHMRTGRDGRESLLLLNASHWGNHHHSDSLGLYYWKNGQELLSDLGYLWDNPLKHQTARTVAHNTVVIDEQDQRSSDRGGDVVFFQTSPHVKAMRARSNAYQQAKRYERTSAIIDHGDGRSYIVDYFAVQGGKTADYVFHGPNQTFQIAGATAASSEQTLYDFSNVRGIDARASSSWRIDWTMPDETQFTAWSFPQRQEKALIADGWGQRNPYNKDEGVTIPYIVRRCTGDGLHRFVSVFESHLPRQPFVKSIERVDENPDRVALKVETADGSDYIECTGTGVRAFSRRGDQTEWTFDHAH